MKVSLLFLMLAIYGAVADDGTEASDEVQSAEEVSEAGDNTEDSSIKADIDALLDDVLENTQEALDIKVNTIEKINNLIGGWVESATNNAADNSEKLATQEKDFVSTLTSNAQLLAEKKKELNDRAANLAGKFLGSGAADFLKDMNNKQLEAQKGFLSWGQKISEGIIDKKNEFNKNVASGIQKASSKVNQVANEKHQKLGQVEKNVASNIIGGLKEINGRFG